MKDLLLALGVVVTLVGGLERVGEMATFCAVRLTQAEGLEELLDLDLDLDVNLDPDADQAVDQVYPPASSSGRDAP